MSEQDQPKDARKALGQQSPNATSKPQPLYSNSEMFDATLEATRMVETTRDEQVYHLGISLLTKLSTHGMLQEDKNPRHIGSGMYTRNPVPLEDAQAELYDWFT